MKRSDLQLQTCTIARAVAQVGDEWTLLMVLSDKLDVPLVGT
jgi:DNA-binding HxlR family transcriptional regulator